MGVKLMQVGNVWVTEFLGKARHFIMDSSLVTWRSLGILPGAALEFSTDLDGSLLSVRNVATNQLLSELEIPKQHSVAGTIKPTKLFVPKEQPC